MRKVVLNLAVSLDGFIEGPNGEYDWCLADQDYGMTEFFAQTDTIFIGRKSYEMIAGMEDEYFPHIQKVYVFSDSLNTAANAKVEFIKSADFDERVKAILELDGSNIWLFGGANLLSTFLQRRLVAEMLLSVHPLILGSGKPLFTELNNRVDLLLQNTQTYDTGLVQLRYALKPMFDNSLLDTPFVHSGLDDF
ncbi:dihydrofolate reductase family protein [Mucilaginibacter sp. PAMB04168]|uniref:dihydrofolate reductase family protein n=1 Tax=Mucilaginibacter sp. PAMB04168 TaxID=3138567 RepID=UPI0031F65729